MAAAVGDAIARGAIGFDAIKHLVLCRIERRPPRLDMTVYPYLPQGDGGDDLGARRTWTCWRERRHDRHARRFCSPITSRR